MDLGKILWGIFSSVICHLRLNIQIKRANRKAFSISPLGNPIPNNSISMCQQIIENTVYRKKILRSQFLKSLCLCSFVPMSLWPYILMCLCPYVPMSICPSVRMSVCPYVSSSLSSYVCMLLCLYLPMFLCPLSPYVHKSLCSFVLISLCSYLP